MFDFEFFVRPFAGLMSKNEKRILVYAHCWFPDPLEIGIEPMALIPKFMLDVTFYTSADTRYNEAYKRQFVAVKFEPLSTRKSDARKSDAVSLL